MDLHGLRVFHATGTEGSVSRAAVKLNCVQSNVTARIKQLEAELEVTLFYRKRRGMVLTPAGRILMGYAEKAQQLFAEARKAVQGEGVVKGPLVIGCLESTAAVRLPDVLARFHQTYPEVELTIQTGTDAELKRMVAAYQVDGALVEAFPENALFEQLPLFYEELVLVSGLQTPPPESMTCPTLIVFPSGCTYRRILEGWFAHRGIHACKVMEFGSHEGIIGCVAAGLGVTIFPRSLLGKLHHRKSIITHDLPKESGQLVIQWVTRRDTYASQAMTAFQAMLFAERS